MRILRVADKDSLPEVAKRYGVSEQSIYGWSKRFSGMAADDIKALKSLSQENTRLESGLDIISLVLLALFGFACSQTQIPARPH